MSSEKVMSIGDVSRHFGVKVWRIRRLYERGLLPPAERLGQYRMIAVEDLPEIEAALRSAGYLRREELAHA